MDFIKSLVINHYLHCAGAVAAGIAARHYLDEGILFVLRFIKPEQAKAVIVKAELFLDSEIDKEAAIPAAPVAAQPKP
jgi:hypothetical protein